jgi:hypothetical protein
VALLTLSLQDRRDVPGERDRSRRRPLRPYRHRPASNDGEDRCGNASSQHHLFFLFLIVGVGVKL